MENNEEKMILVLEADKSNLNQFIFDLSWEHLDKVKGNEISRAEAIERMAKGLYEYQYPKMRPYWDDDDNGHKEFYLKRAEAALNALLGKEAENGNN